jgi:iron complex transport system substrate-binding protein
MIFKRASAALGLALAMSAHAGASAAITVIDDAGRSVTVAAPARRVIALAPHVTELLFAAGGGTQVVGAMNYSDYPPEAKRLPLVGSDAQIDIERVLALKPDLLVVWQSGNTARQLEQLAALGIPVFYSEPRKLEQVATSLQRLGVLMGTSVAAERAAGSFRTAIASLRARYARARPVPVFYQVWDKPIYTLSAGHIVSDVISLCGGRNVFGALATVAPSVSIEAVLQANPEAIFGSEAQDANDAGITMWQPYKRLLAVERGNLFRVPGVLLTRPGPRLAEGARMLCEDLALARTRSAPPHDKALQP